MYRYTLLALLAPSLAFAGGLSPLASGLKSPTAVAAAGDGRVFVATAGEVQLLKDGKAEPFATGFDAPAGLVVYQQSLFVADKTRVRRVDLKTGKADVWADEKDFPAKPQALTGIAADQFGNLYVTDAGDGKGSGGAITRIGSRFTRPGQPPARGELKLVAEATKADFLKSPRGVAVDSMFHLLVLDGVSGELTRYRMSDGKAEKVADGFQGGGGLAFDHFGRLYITSTSQGKLWAIPRPDEKPVLMTDQVKNAAGVCCHPAGGVLVATGSEVTAVKTPIPGWEVDTTPLPLATEVAFGDVKWTGWDSGEDSGKTNPLRPLVLTHAGDGTNRTFVATQHGVIHVLPTDGAKATSVFLDIQPKVLYKDSENEQGLLGLAFHPKYKSNGEFFVFYTDKSKKLENVLSRFKVSKDDPNKADPASEEELLRVSHRFWNHDGGTVCFGPDGHLYVVLGDGGAANDPDDHGQKMNALLGKILRIDVNGKGETTKYAIPKDNPFVGVKDARPEIFALGVRNPWRLAFDRKTGQGWFGEVGQDLWEEINLLEKGANYGWRRRESLHPFGADGVGPKKELTDPIWEYHHDVGKSITGGHVYRGKALPELDGMYLYADYVTGRIWALKYDAAKKRVTANRPIADKASPIMSFGEDEAGEVYLLTYSANGKGISRFVKADGKK